MSGMTVVYLVQHGDKQPGPGDPGLTELGRMQATRTGQRLGGLSVGALLTSPMRRARETAESIAAVTSLPIQADARLRERLNWDASMPWRPSRTCGFARLTTSIWWPPAVSPPGRPEPGLLAAGIPACAITSIDNQNPVMIASMSHLK
jgi:hypothetical protein